MDGLTGTERGAGFEPTEALSWFISPHGFGHAARTSSIVAAVSRRCPETRHHLFTTVPRAFFDDSLVGVSFEFHPLECDVGMVQRTPLVEDLHGTVRALEKLPLDGGPDFDDMVHEVAATGSRSIISDIAPLGLAVADRLGLPGVLVENFTWDWIYGAYDDSRLAAFGQRQAEVFSSAALRIQTAPVCREVHGARQVPPVSRSPRLSPDELRRRLGVGADQRLVLLSVGGLDRTSIARGFRPPDGAIVVAPGTGDALDSRGNPIWIPTMGGPYHPDLVAASDLVVAKLGYSTVAEVYHAGTALAYLRRPTFPESPVLEAFVREFLPSAPLPDDWLGHPSTTRVLTELLEAPRPRELRANGAEAAAGLILEALGRSHRGP